MEQQSLLRHIGNLTAQTLLGATRNVLPIHEHAAILDVVQAKQQLGERRFTRARFSHQAHTLARRHMQRKVVEHALARCGIAIGKAQMLEINRALTHLELRRTLIVCHQAWLIQHARHLGGIAQRTVDALHHGAHVVEAHGEVVRVGENHNKRTGRNTKPRIATRHENAHHGHGDNNKAGSREVALHHGVHRNRLGIARGAVGVVE